MLKALSSILFITTLAFCYQGIDISAYQGAPSQSVFNCFVQNGKEFMSIQIWQGGYGINRNYAGNWAKAKAAGIKYVDAYAFACNNCEGNTPSNICSSIKLNLPSGFDGYVWIDIEDCTGCWTGTSAERLAFLEEVASTCTGIGIHTGIYSGTGSWGQVFGSASFDGGSLKNFPLWYAHYDGNPSMSDWNSVRFGGFETPNVKQYAGSTSLCGTSVDLDAY